MKEGISSEAADYIVARAPKAAYEIVERCLFNHGVDDQRIWRPLLAAGLGPRTTRCSGSRRSFLECLLVDGVSEKARMILPAFLDPMTPLQASALLSIETNDHPLATVCIFRQQSGGEFAWILDEFEKRGAGLRLVKKPDPLLLSAVRLPHSGDIVLELKSRGLCPGGEATARGMAWNFHGNDTTAKLAQLCELGMIDVKRAMHFVELVEAGPSPIGANAKEIGAVLRAYMARSAASCAVDKASGKLEVGT